MNDILDTVPRALRDKIDHYEMVLPALLSAQLADADLDAAVGYMQGAIEHQRRLHLAESTKMESKVFKGVIRRVEIITRKSGDRVLGKKAMIHFEGASQKGDNSQQDIMTDWIEYDGFDAPKEAFAVALSNTIVEIAEANIGRECFIRKAFVEAPTASGGSSVRYIADLYPAGNSGKSSSAPRQEEGSRSSSSKRSPAPEPASEPEKEQGGSGEILGEDLLDLVKSAKLKVKLSGEDFRVVADIVNDFGGDMDPDYETIAKDLAKEFELNKLEIESLVDATENKTGDDFLEALIQALDETQ